MADLEKQYKQKLKETRNLLNDLFELRKKGMHRNDKSINEKLERLGQLMEVAEEQLIAKNDDDSLDQMINRLNSDLLCLNKLLESRPANTAAEILANASEGLALKGILVGKDFRDDCVKRIVLSAPTDIELMIPVLMQYDNEEHFSSRAELNFFHRSLDIMGCSVACTMEVGHWGLKTEGEFSKQDKGKEEKAFQEQTNFEAMVIYSVVPTAAIDLSPCVCKLSPQALLELKVIDRLLVESQNTEILNRKCQEFLSAYGSHINVGVLHFGGVNKFVVTYTSETKSRSDKTKCMIQDALIAYASGGYYGLGMNVGGYVSAGHITSHCNFRTEYEKSEQEKTFLHTTRNGGPQEVCALQLWKMGLVICNSTWALIDRGRSLFTDFVGVWKLISNHKGEFKKPLDLEGYLMRAWERMSGNLGFNDRGRTFIEGLTQMNKLIEKIAEWNCCPILPEKCIEYLEEMLNTVEDVETQTGSNKYWVSKLCTEVNISCFLRKVLELRDEFDSKNVPMIKSLMKQLVNPVGFREFPGKDNIIQWVILTKTEEDPSLPAKFSAQSMPDLIRYLKEIFIPTLETEHGKNVEGSTQVCNSINERARLDLADCIGQILHSLEASEKEHEMFFVNVACLLLHFHPPSMKVMTLLAMEQLQDFVKSIEVSWKEYQIHKKKGIIQLEAFLIKTSLTCGYFSEEGKKSEQEFSELITKFRHVLSPELKTILNKFATHSPFNWSEMIRVTTELANGNMLFCEEVVEIGVLVDVLSPPKRETNEEAHMPVVTTNSEVAAVQGDFSYILKALGLENYYPSKISLLEAMEIKMTTGEIKLVDIPWIIIHKLLMIDFHARDGFLSVVNKSLVEERPDDGGMFDLEAILEMQNAGGAGEEGRAKPLNTLDVIVAIFTCCDNFLKQTLAQKLFVCKLAIPFLYPLGSESNVGMSLWALRTISVQRHIKQKEAIETSVTESFPVVTFVKLGKPPLSKSKLMNDILRDDSHDTFFHSDCKNGAINRSITDGLVECSWFITAGKEIEHLPITTMLLNLRGDATLMKKQMQILQEISSVVFVTVTAQDLSRNPYTKTCQSILKSSAKVILLLICGKNEKSTRELQACYEAVGRDFLKGVPIILSSSRQGIQKNASELKTESRERLSEAIIGSSSILIEECIRRAREQGIIVDEYDDEACLKGKSFAEKVVSHMKDKEIVDCKALLLPLQGTEWLEYCKLLKKQHRIRVSSKSSSANLDDQLNQMMIHHRQKQVEKCSGLTPFITEFVSILRENPDVVMYFLKWMDILLDNISRANLPRLRREYHAFWTKYQEAKKIQENPTTKHLKSQVDYAENMLSSASLGLENLFREIGQIYEAVKWSGRIATDTKVVVEYLPERAARLLLKGVPLELVDGDASSVPIAWISAVLNKLEDIIGPKNLFVLSVLGIQSSGKSTFLNTMFGLQFTVSAGRCTRGAYMQLIPVDECTDLPFDYVVVVDTEGLRAPELGQLKCEHDNELATLVIGLGDVTMINIKGENTAEMKDILQIAVHAFLRMNLVSRHIQDHRTCIFVHQNVPAANADELMMHGCQKLQESLDDMVKEAALSENIADICSFSQIIDFDVRKHVWYFPDLWHGNPPMAPANPGYSEKVDAVRINLLGEIAKGKKFLKASELSIRLADLWNGVLSDDFVFSFRNSLEVKAYNVLQSKYYNLEWELQNKMKSWTHAAEIELKRCETIEDLDKSYQSLLVDLSKVLTEKAEEIKNSLIDFFEKYDLQNIIIQWKGSKLNLLSNTVEQHLSEGKADLLSIKDARRVEILQAQKWSDHEKHIMGKAVELADKLKGKQATDEEMERQFESMWVSMEKDLAAKTADKVCEMDILMEEILRERFYAHGHLLTEELRRYPLSISCEPTKFENKVPSDFVGKDDISPKRNFLQKGLNLMTGADNPELEARNKTLVLTNRILRDISTHLKRLSRYDVKFQPSHAKEVIQFLDEIDTHNKNAQASKDNFTILPQYAVKLAVYVSRHCVQVFNLMQHEYIKKHGMKAKLQDYKNTAWSLFKNTVKHSTEEVLAADLLCTHLKGIVQKTVKKAIPRKCTEEILRDFQMTKYYMMVKILDDLAERGIFKEYRFYMRNAKEFALQWITRYTNKKMFLRSNASEMSRYEEIGNSHIARIMQCIKKSVKHATDEVSGKMFMPMTRWVKRFCQRVSEEIAVPESTLTLVSVRSVGDFKNLQRIIGDKLDKIQADLEKAFANETEHSVDWEGTSPPQQVLDKIWGCPEQCPFCEEPCADTTPDHYDLSKKCHMCVQHKPQGIGGIYWRNDGNIDGVNYCKGQLLHEICNYSIQREGRFGCSACRYKCRDSGKCSTTGAEQEFHKCTEYKTYMPDWDIAPNPTNDVSRYWMWFMVTYQHQLKDIHNTNLPNLPKNWTKITKAEALADLRKIHH